MRGSSGTAGRHSLAIFGRQWQPVAARRSGGAKVLPEEGDRSRPCVGGRAGSVGVGARVVEERMAGARVGADLEVLAGRRQDVAQRLDVGQRDEAVLLAEEPEVRARESRREIE